MTIKKPNIIKTSAFTFHFSLFFLFHFLYNFYKEMPNKERLIKRKGFGAMEKNTKRRLIQGARKKERKENKVVGILVLL